MSELPQRQEGKDGQMSDLNFDKWCDEMDAHGRRRGMDFDYTRAMGRDCFRETFEGGMSPEDAMEEEMSAAAGDLE